jgi:DNA-binding response OmpR family regulator
VRPDTAANILIADDEPRTVRGVRAAFEGHGFEVVAVADGLLGFDLALSGHLDLLVIDRHLPKKDGFQFCRELRQRGVGTPILLLMDRHEELDRVAGLELGADDCLTKPFGVRELVARARALLRRATPVLPLATGRVRIGEAEVDFREHLMARDGVVCPLTRTEVSLLRIFVNHPREVIARERLLQDVWGGEAPATSRSMDTFIRRLRQKIEPDSHHPVHLITVHGCGYKYVPAARP